MNVNYASGLAPEEYCCAKCGAHDCKLWRQYNTCADYIELMCAACAMRDQGQNLIVDRSGRSEDADGLWSDQIGVLVPAVPDEEGVSFWGYTSVPPAGVAWWRNLSSYPSSSPFKEARP
jgi:hypothetical protein